MEKHGLLSARSGRHPAPRARCIPRRRELRRNEGARADALDEAPEPARSRLGGKRFDDTGYAREELVAELGAAFLCAGPGIMPEPREDRASYLAHWLEILREDKRAIFAAAAHAQRAVDFPHSLSPCEEATLQPAAEAAEGGAVRRARSRATPQLLGWLLRLPR